MYCAETTNMFTCKAYFPVSHRKKPGVLCFPRKRRKKRVEILFLCCNFCALLGRFSARVLQPLSRRCTKKKKKKHEQIKYIFWIFIYTFAAQINSRTIHTQFLFTMNSRNDCSLNSSQERLSVALKKESITVII